MDWVHFSSRVIEALAWPAFILIFLVLIHKKLPGLLDRLVEITFPGGKAVFKKGLEEAREGAEDLPVSKNAQSPPAMAPDDPYLQLAQNHPEAAILEAYKRIERFLLEKSTEYPQLNTKNPLALAQQLEKQGDLDPGALTLIRKVRTVRNAAVHAKATTITPGEAIEFHCLCDEVIQKLAEGLRHASARIRKSPHVVAVDASATENKVSPPS